MLRVILINPVLTISILPHTLSYCIFSWIEKYALSMLFSILPFSFIYSTVRPSKYSVPMLFIINVASFILFSIGPFKNTLSMHFVSFSIANIRPLIDSILCPFPFDLIHFKISIVLTSVGPLKFTFTMLCSFIKLSNILRTIRKHFFPMAPLLSFNEFSCIFWFCITIV